MPAIDPNKILQLNQNTIYFKAKIHKLIEYIEDPSDGDINYVLEELRQLERCIE